MMMADAMDDSAMLPDMDPGDFSNCPDNMTISLDTLFAILDEKPDLSNDQSSGNHRVFNEGMLAPDQFHSENVVQLQPEPIPVTEGFREAGSYQWDLADCKDEQEIVFSSDVHGSSFDSTHSFSSLPNYNMKQYTSQLTDINNTFSNPLDYSFEGLESEKDSVLMDSDRGSFPDLVATELDVKQLQDETQTCGGTSEGTVGGSIHSQNADPLFNYHLTSTKEGDNQPMGGETLSYMRLGESKFNLDVVSSVSVRQEGEDNQQTNSHSDCQNESGCDARDNYLALSGNLIEDADNASQETLSVHLFDPFMLGEKELMIGTEFETAKQLLPSQNLYRNSDIQLDTLEQFLHASKQVSVTAAKSSVPDMLYGELNLCQDVSMKSESSTDSSPIPYHGSFNYERIYKSDSNASRQLICHESIISSNKQKICTKDEAEKLMPTSFYNQYGIPKNSKDYVPKNCSRSSFIVDNENDNDDDDVCILDDIRGFGYPVPPIAQINLHPMAHQLRPGDPYLSGSGYVRLSVDDERLTYRIALQDLSQPKSEANPPDGVLTVPLLRHQRIALSWMVQKETTSPHCSGGILADDQGLGKTVSTIALILTERPISQISSSLTEKKDNFQALVLDEDDEDEISELTVGQHPWKTSLEMANTTNYMEDSVMVKGRPSAGTLVVCPTSVLRQWAEELQNKVSSKANLSFLVYHGSNRTKDPNELAKYDVVLTTYAIVSMEVPKQPHVDKDDEEKGTNVDPSAELLNARKRKFTSSSNLKKDGNRLDSAFLDSAARPLARVWWFRVILDEAQSIKNHRTQVARACWGLRAKRRWCLSGTPIQNAVDDLYSYFRFLRFDPYAVYSSFCKTIKVPISKDPNTGYKKLQVVLKTIMLRRTKGTLIDGKPIITLPPKTVTLKKVDFSKEERSFYATLEAESQEQFKEYAAAGTVKQNYVNILLMLLRLRQACDHPLLIKGHDSNSIGRNSTEMARKLPRDKQVELLTCLEACLAICSICKDPPEDAVVAICGHVFCNQCISERLTGDDHVCPFAGCKRQLNLALVFSRGALKSSLSGSVSNELLDNGSGCEVINPPMQIDESLSSNSSKIRAALEILQSLARHQNSSRNIPMNSSSDLKSGCSVVTVRSSLGASDTKIAELNNDLNSHVTEKAIVFSQWTRMLDLLEVPLRESCIQFRRLDGTMSVAAREKAVKDFNNRPEVTVMIMSLKAASLGLNMVAACHVLLLDLWWNPTTEDQAIDRAHRIGQTRPVTVSRLTVENTVEDRILALQEKKREMVASAFGEESGSRQTRLTVEDLKYLFAV